MRLDSFIRDRTVLIAAVALLILTAPPALAQTVDPNLWMANNAVTTTVRAGNLLYIGGTFTSVYPLTGGGVAIDLEEQRPVSPYPRVTGSVYAAIPDGSGGWFIGGSFTLVGTDARANLAHVLADGSVDPWNPGANGAVYALARTGGVLYAGGAFTFAGNQSRANIVAISETTGLATAWNPGANSFVAALLLDGSTLYVGGNFSTMNSQSRVGFASFDTSGGALTAWNPVANSTVSCLAKSGSTI
jgi:hypothetical protein